jgi:hypothetical protein
MEAGAARLRDGNKLEEKRASRMVVVKVLTHRPNVPSFLSQKNHIEFSHTQSTSDFSRAAKSSDVTATCIDENVSRRQKDREKNVVLPFNSADDRVMWSRGNQRLRHGSRLRST